MKKRNLLFILLFTIAISLISCPPTEDDDETEIIITGTVLSVSDYEPISGASVTIAGVIATTDSDGEYTLTLDSIDGADAVAISKSGFIPYHKPIGTITNDGLLLEAFLLPVGIRETINPSAENTVTTTDGASVEFPVMSGITEDLIVEVTNINVSTDEIFCAPGDFSAVDETEADATLISLGMVQVDITGADSGDSYSLDGKGPFSITIPMTGDPGIAPGVIPLWFYDREEGVWYEQGEATLSDDVYIGTVSHFTTWNADLAMSNYTCVTGTINDLNYSGTDWYRISISCRGMRKEHTQHDTTFTIQRVPLGTDFTVSVVKLPNRESTYKTATTPASASYSCFNLGSFLLQETTPPVRSLITRVVGDDIIINWSDPSHTDFIDVEINYQSENDSIDVTDTVDAGVEEYMIADCAEDVYRIMVTSLFTGGGRSFDVVKYVKVADVYTVSVEIVEPEEGDVEVFIIINGVTPGFYYTDPFDCPPGTILTFEMEYDEQLYPPGGEYEPIWSFNNQGWEIANPKTTTMPSEDLYVNAMLQNPGK